jgi:hypothetical protein
LGLGVRVKGAGVWYGYNGIKWSQQMIADCWWLFSFWVLLLVVSGDGASAAWMNHNRWRPGCWGRLNIKPKRWIKQVAHHPLITHPSVSHPINSFHPSRKKGSIPNKQASCIGGSRATNRVLLRTTTRDQFLVPLAASPADRKKREGWGVSSTILQPLPISYHFNALTLPIVFAAVKIRLHTHKLFLKCFICGGIGRIFFALNPPPPPCSFFLPNYCSNSSPTTEPMNPNNDCNCDS